MSDGPIHFPTTQWSMLARAGRGRDSAEVDALLRRYLPPLRAYLRLTRGLEADLAEELLQEFIASRVLENEMIARADAARGRFRNLLLGSLNRFLVDAARRRGAEKRGGGRVASLQALAGGDLVGRSEDPTRRFESELARRIIESTLGRVEAWCAQTGQRSAWELLRLQVVEPTLHNAPRVAYADLIERLGIESPVQAASLLQTAKRIFKRQLRDVLGEYGFCPDDDADIAELIEMLRQPSARWVDVLRM